jgi:Phosphotransferase enzyme family
MAPTSLAASGVAPARATTATTASSRVEPGWPRDLRQLLGRRSHDLLQSVLDEAGGELIAHTPRQVNHQPGRSTTVQYRAVVRWRDGHETTEMLVAKTGSGLPSGAAIVEGSGARTAVWHWRRDPALPGLDAALDVGRVTALLDDLGIRRRTTDPTRLATRAYRPGRRAVIQATTGDRSVFLKVVRPHLVQPLHETHRRLATLMPSPDSLGWSSDGILVMPGLPGDTLRSVLRSAGAAPGPDAISSLLDQIPTDIGGAPRTDHPLVAARHHASTIAVVAPSLRSLVERTLDDVESTAAQRHGEHLLVGVHGDLYEAQLLVDGLDGDPDAFSAILDLDTARPGHRIDDLANFCAHLSVLALTMPRRDAARINAYGSALLTHAETSFDRRDIRTRIAAYVLGLATGPFRVLEPGWKASTERRLGLARTWVESAARSPRRSPST